MKVHSSLLKRPAVLLQILICMGALSSTEAINVKQLESNTILSNNQITANILAQL